MAFSLKPQPPSKYSLSPTVSTAIPPLFGHGVGTIQINFQLRVDGCGSSTHSIVFHFEVSLHKAYTHVSWQLYFWRVWKNSWLQRRARHVLDTQLSIKWWYLGTRARQRSDISSGKPGMTGTCVASVSMSSCFGLKRRKSWNHDLKIG